MMVTQRLLLEILLNIANTYRTRYASIEVEGDGYAVYNDVTGLLVDTYQSLRAARAMVTEITQRYRAIEYGCN
jgi:hypothetical protein